MHRIRRGIVGAAALLLVGVSPVLAQDWRFDLGVNAGGAFRTTSVEASKLGGSDALKFAPGWIVGAQAGVKIVKAVELRANGAYSRAPFKLGSTSLLDALDRKLTTPLWSLSGDLMFRLKQPAAQFTKSEFLPYIAAGAGLRWIHPKSDLTGALLGDTVHDGAFFAAGNGDFLLRHEEVPMGLVGLGADYRIKPHLAVRLEVGDRFFKPLVDAVTGNTVTTADIGKLTHEFYATVGLQLLAKLAGAPVVAVTPPPPPPPPPPAAPQQPAAPPAAPPPPPDQPVSVCVVDPGVAAGMQPVDALVAPQTGDTVVVVAGARRALRDVYADRPILADQDWFNRGAPLALGPAVNPVKYIPAGTPAAVQPGSVTYIGLAGKLPLFADTQEAADLIKRLDAAGPKGDVSALASQQRGVLRSLREVKTLYAPAARTGCVMQPLQLQSEVRKVRG